jgi:hypothetical protein
MAGFLSAFLMIFLLFFARPTARIWKPVRSGESEKSMADRVAWTIFSVGLALMLSLVLIVMVQEDGSYRTWETIRLHVRCFLGLSIIPIAGPLIVFLSQRTKTITRRKAPVDDLD